MIVERSALELNPILILNIRVKRVADTEIKSDINLEHKGQAVADTRTKPTD